MVLSFFEPKKAIFLENIWGAEKAPSMTKRIFLTPCQIGLKDIKYVNIDATTKMFQKHIYSRKKQLIMDTTKRIYQRKNPQESAGFLSICFFWYEVKKLQKLFNLLFDEFIPM